MLCSFPHNSTVYTYWGGHVTIGKNNQNLKVTACINDANLLVEPFTQQTTLLYYIRVIPTVGFNQSVSLKLKYMVRFFYNYII